MLVVLIIAGVRRRRGDWRRLRFFFIKWIGKYNVVCPVSSVVQRVDVEIGVVPQIINTDIQLAIFEGCV